MANELLILSRAIHFGSCLVLLAVFAVRLLIERPAADAPGARRLAAACLALAAGSGFPWLWASIAGMSDSTLRDALSLQLFTVVIQQTQPGHVWVARLAIAVLLGITLCFLPRRWAWRAGAGLAVALTGSLSWLGHAGAGEEGRRSVMLAADVSHLLAVSLWPAGLLPFALLLHRRIQAGELKAAYVVARRFSAMSLLAVSVIVVSGLANSYFLVGSLHAFVATNYGRLLAVKLLFFGVAASLGAWNLLVHEPRIPVSPEALAAMRYKIWIELALGGSIVAIVALLGTLAPGSSPGG